MKPSIDLLAIEVSALDSAVICSHIAPDPDAMGSAGAFQLLLSALDVTASVFLREPLPEKYASLFGDIPVLNNVPESSDATFIGLDTATLARVGDEVQPLVSASPKVLNIDHHQSNTKWGDFNYIDSTAAATALIVFELYAELGVALTPHAATLLYAGLMDDTGSFRFSNTDARCLKVAAELVDAGAEPEKIANTLYFSTPEKVLRLRAAAVEGLQILLDGKLAIVSVSQELLQRFDASPEDSDGIVDIARSVDGTQAAAFARQLDDCWKVSLRAKDSSVDVNAVASVFGGGGHRAAAGCSVVGSLEEVIEQVTAEFRKQLS